MFCTRKQGKILRRKNALDRPVENKTRWTKRTTRIRRTVTLMVQRPTIAQISKRAMMRGQIQGCFYSQKMTGLSSRKISKKYFEFEHRIQTLL